MVMWQEIWIYLIICNSTSFYLIEKGFLLEIIEFYAGNYYQVFIISFPNFLSYAKFIMYLLCQIWTSYMTLQ